MSWLSRTLRSSSLSVSGSGMAAISQPAGGFFSTENYSNFTTVATNSTCTLQGHTTSISTQSTESTGSVTVLRHNYCCKYTEGCFRPFSTTGLMRTKPCWAGGLFLFHYTHTQAKLKQAETPVFSSASKQGQSEPSLPSTGPRWHRCHWLAQTSFSVSEETEHCVYNTREYPVDVSVKIISYFIVKSTNSMVNEMQALFTQCAMRNLLGAISETRHNPLSDSEPMPYSFIGFSFCFMFEPLNKDQKCGNI